MRKNGWRGSLLGAVLAGVVLTMAASTAGAQGPMGNEGYTFGIYYVNYGFYPVVQVYLRTFDENREPLQNVNYANIGIQVAGKNYDPGLVDLQNRRFQYGVESLENRKESFRTVFVWDCSGSMAGQPFEDTRSAIAKYIQAKRPGDQVAILAIRDTNEGYQKVSSFEKDPTLLYQRMDDVKPDGQKTRLYDSIAAALEMCTLASQGSVNNLDGEFAVLNTIIVLSDGKDEGSAISKDALVNRIGTLNPPVPIYSLAYSSKKETEYFTNLEAVSKAALSRYWTAAETQEFATVLQKIHYINRKDYVVTFRANVPEDGGEHNFAVGIAWPSGSGRFVFREGKFKAVESPAIFDPKAKAYWEDLLAKYPDLTNIPPLPPPPPQDVRGVLPIRSGPEGEGEGEGEPIPVPDPPVKPDTGNNDTLMLLLIAAVGVCILLLVMIIVIWVRTGASANRRPPMGPGTGTGAPPPTSHTH